MPYGILDDRLTQDGLPVRQATSPNVSGFFKTGRRRFVVVHYTAGPSLEGALRTFADPNRKASAHLVIDRDGGVVQVVPLDRIAWHAGESEWIPRGPMGGFGRLKGMNGYSVGVELVNAGHVGLVGGKFVAWWGGEISSSDVVEVDPKQPGSFGRRFWHRFPEAQLAACIEILKVMVDEFELEDVLGHSDVSPGRKTDPGPAFPLASVRSQLFGRA